MLAQYEMSGRNPTGLGERKLVPVEQVEISVTTRIKTQEWEERNRQEKCRNQQINKRRNGACLDNEKLSRTLMSVYTVRRSPYSSAPQINNNPRTSR